jgi:shikimate kinase
VNAKRSALRRHVVLIGLPGSGKTTAGRLAATSLGAPFIDIDEWIVECAGRSVAAIFEEDGEPAFRTLEREQMERALAGEPAVLAPGGGWAAEPGAIETVGNRALLIYLETTPRTATARATAEGGRPLLSGDAAARMVALWQARRHAYSRAHARVRTDLRTAEEVASEVVRLARSLAGW